MHLIHNGCLMASDAAELLEAEQVSKVVERWETLDEPFARTLQSGVSRAQALGKLGIRLCIQARYPESLAVLRAAAALAPGDIDILGNMAVVLDRSGQTPQAIACVERSLALSNDQPDSWLFLGNMKAKCNDLVGAQAAFEAALALNENSPLAWQGLGLVKQARRQFHEAIECFLNCIRQSHMTPPLLAILGQLFYGTGQFEKSRNAYGAAMEGDRQNRMYRQMYRETVFLCAVIAGESIDDALHAYRSDSAAFPGTQDKNERELLQAVFSLLSAYGNKEAALRVGAKRVALFPASAAAEYQLRALEGDASVSRSPDAYLVEYFNDFAGRFDEHLVKTLGYETPRQLAAAVAPLLPAGFKGDVLDAGCGTGLCGPHIHGLAASLTGVDLSPAMLERARERKLYDRLVCHELTSFLYAAPSAFDLIVAADVLIYFGDLAPVAQAIAGSLRSGGLLAFSTEAAAAPGFQLLTSGRFAHHLDYVRSVFGADFIECLAQDRTIRLEASRPVAGNVFVFRRR